MARTEWGLGLKDAKVLIETFMQDVFGANYHQDIGA
jgi:hypothetical protein